MYQRDVTRYIVVTRYIEQVDITSTIQPNET